MSTYTMKIELPDDVRQFFEALNGQAVIHEITDGGAQVRVSFEHDGDDYDLALRAQEITREAERFVGEDITFTRPARIEAP